METVTRNISEISPPDRLALEHVLGHALGERQQIIIQVIDLAQNESKAINTTTTSKSLPAWCKVYAGLSDQEIASLEEVALQRPNLTRPTE